MSKNDDDLVVWNTWHLGTKCPGSAEPLPGKCGSRMRSKDLKALNIVRHCTKSQGYGTPNTTGVCKLHGGSTPTHMVKAARDELAIDIRTLSEQLGEAPPLGPPEVEALRMGAKMKKFMLIMEKKMDELNGTYTSFDAKGTEQVRAQVELLERSVERFQRTLEFLLKHDLDRRVVQLEEQQARGVGEIFLKIISSQELKLTEAQFETARRLFYEQMSAANNLSPSWSMEVDDENIIDAEVVEND